MANVSLTTLEDLGWKPYWDNMGHHPVKEGDILKISPSETIRIFWLAVPVQEEDGKWYANAIYMYEPFPSLVGGVYRVEDILVDSTLFGGDNGMSLSGKVEEFAFWSKDIEHAGVQNYQLNMTGMIGGDAGDRYGSIAAAKNGGLKYYYAFNDSNLLVKNFSGDGASIIKSKVMSIGGGKHGNSNEIEESEYMKIEGMNFSEEFTFNIRFYLNSDTDFILFENPEAIKIEYDASNRVFVLDFSPYIGNKKRYNIEFPEMKVHEWYDFAIRYSDGKLFVIINGEELERFSPSATIGGYKRTIADFRNISKATVFSGSGLGIVYPLNTANYQYQLNAGVSPTGDIESEKMSDQIYSDNFTYRFDGGKNAMSLIYDKKNDVMAGLSVNVSETNTPTITDIDAVSGKKEVSFTAIPNMYSFKYCPIWSISEEEEGSKLKIRGRQASIGSTYFYGNINNGSWIPNLIAPGMPILLELKVRDNIVDQNNVFPKLSIFPGTRIKVIKKEMTPPVNSDEYAGLSHGSGVRGYAMRVWGDDTEIITATSKVTDRTYGGSNIRAPGTAEGIEIYYNSGVIYRAGTMNRGGQYPQTPTNFTFKRLKNW